MVLYMKTLLHILINALVILGLSHFLAGVYVSGFGTAVIVAIVLGIVNILIKPLLLILTLPINILTLGLFTLVINALMIMLVSALVPGFNVAGFSWALITGIVMSLVGYVVHSIE